jgi:hypothetical protein
VDTQSSPSAPPALDLPILADLVAAGLVSHEMIGDPARLGSEAETLGVLCAEIEGPVWRLGPFHYAFRARPEDLGGRLAALDPVDWAGAIETTLRVALGVALGEEGAEAIWISAADLATDLDTDLGAEEGASFPEAPLLLLGAQDAAVAAGLAAAGPGTQAVVHARFAVEAARLAAGLLAEAEPGSALARRLAMIETRQEEMLEMLVERAEEAATLGSLAAVLSAALDRLDAQAATLAGLAAESGLVAARVAALTAAAEAAPDAAAAASEAASEAAGRAVAAVAAETAAFRQDLGLALAEFLARLEQEAARRPAPRHDPAPETVPETALQMAPELAPVPRLG